MKDIDWGMELCGKVITPEEWAGGVACASKEWFSVERVRPCERGDTTQCAHFARSMTELYWPGLASIPIYPPGGWAGCTEAELWEAMIGRPDRFQFIPDHTGIEFLRNKPWDELPDEPHLDISSMYVSASVIPQMILALQNALVLSKRLKDGAE